MSGELDNIAKCACHTNGVGKQQWLHQDVETLQKITYKYSHYKWPHKEYESLGLNAIHGFLIVSSRFFWYIETFQTTC